MSGEINGEYQAAPVSQDRSTPVPEQVVGTGGTWDDR